MESFVRAGKESAWKNPRTGQSAQCRAGPWRKPGILVVDDEAAVRGLLQVALQQQGFMVRLAANGYEALLHQRYSPEMDLVLLDVRMPGLDGPQTLAALQEADPTIVSCFMTGYGGDYTETDLLELGAARVFAKPFRLGELRSVLWQLAAELECRLAESE